MAEAAENIVLCSHPGCQERAAVKYVWAWGEEGASCMAHLPLIRQQAANLKREVSIVAIAPTHPIEVPRDERIALNARVLTLESEIDEAKTRGLAIYQQNTQLAAQCQALQAKNAELEAQANDARHAKEAALKATGEVRKELSSTRDQLEKLKTASTWADPAKMELERRQYREKIESLERQLAEAKKA